MQFKGRYGRWYLKLVQQLGGMKIKELYPNQFFPKQHTRRTWSLPSIVLAMTKVLSTSVARPVMACMLFFTVLIFDFFGLLEAMIFDLVFPGAVPVKLKDLRSFPDCIFHILIPPVEDPTRPKFPHAVTQTA